MKAEKLKSGNYRVQVYDKATGKKKSITCATKKEAERMAAVWYLEHKTENGTLFGFAVDQYIKNRSSVLSPSTVREYKRIKKYLGDLLPVPISNVTNEILQEFVNSFARDHSPKTVKNVYGLITAVLHTYAPDTRFNVQMPKRIRPALYIPKESEIKRLIEAAKGSSAEIPLLLAVFCTMRRGEIAALDIEHINGDVIHVEKAYVLGPDKKWTIKAPKSYAGDRYIKCPSWIIDKINEQGYVTHLAPRGISAAFDRLLNKAGVVHFRFHDLRHYSASMQHALGIPDAYICRAGGWQSDRVLKEVYRHAVAEETDRNTEKWLNYADAFK